MPYCKGCGHGIVSRKLNDALVRSGVSPEEVVITSDIGCVGLVDPLFPEVHTVHTLHGRSTAMAAGAILADRVLFDGRIKNVVMIGDGGATIGLLHLSQAALMNVDMTVLLHNNMLYGMTGGQHSALTPEQFVTSTTLGGNWVPALDMEQFLRGCQAPYFARKLATDADLAEVIAEAIAFPGFALVEILELCTGFAVPLNHMDGKSLRAMADARGHALGVLVRRDDRRPYHEVYREAVGGERIGASSEPPPRSFSHEVSKPLSLVVAGSAGERVQSAAAVVAQAAVLSGLSCIQKNDYPVTVGSGFSLAELKLSPEPILFTGSDAPDAILVVSTDGLKELEKRGDLSRLVTDGTIVADETLAADLSAGNVVSRAFRKTLSPDAAAFGALVFFLRRSGLLHTEAIRAAIGLVGGKGRSALERTLASVATWPV
jgi:pyruvate/2-oxoacid:ferredoxin oxidoreductase beta subunit